MAGPTTTRSPENYWPLCGTHLGAAPSEYRAFHKEATIAEGYQFDENICNCLAVVVGVGQSGDVRWATDEELKEAFA